MDWVRNSLTPDALKLDVFAWCWGALMVKVYGWKRDYINRLHSVDDGGTVGAGINPTEVIR